MPARRPIRHRCKRAVPRPRIVAELTSIMDEMLKCWPQIFLYSRDAKLESDVIRPHKVELKLLSTLGPQMKSWLSLGRIHTNYCEIGQYLIVTKSHSRRDSGLRKALEDSSRALQNCSDALRRFGSQQVIFPGLVPDPLSSCMHQLGQHAAIVSLQANQIVQTPSLEIGQIYNKATASVDFIYTGTPLLDLYSNIVGVVRKEGADRLCDDLSLEIDGLFRLPNIDSRSGWRNVTPDFAPPWPAIDEMSRAWNLDGWPSLVFDRHGRTSYQVLRHWNRSTHKKTLLPVTYWAKQAYSRVFPLYVPPHKTVPLLNGFGLNKRADTPMLVFDSIEITAPRPTMAVNWLGIGVPTSWYGGREAVDLVDWSPLKGRTVYYVICNHSGISEKEARHTAAAVYLKLRDLATSITIVDCFTTFSSQQNIFFSWDWQKKRIGVLQPDELGADLGKAVLRMSSKARDHAAVDGPRLVGLEDAGDVEETAYLIKPVIAERTVTLVYAKAGVGKTWFALEVACSVANGSPVFEKWTSDKPRTVLYVDAEMNEKPMLRRLRVISGTFSENKRQLIHRNLFLAPLGQELLDLSSEEGQTAVERLLVKARKKSGQKVSLLVLDSLGALTGFSDTNKSWKELFSWLKELKKRDISTLIVHHTNKAGAQRGTEYKIAAVDNALFIEDAGGVSTNSIALTIRVEKGRELDGAAKKPLTVEFTPSARNPRWRVRKISSMGPEGKKDREERIRELHEMGWSNREIADDIGMNINTFKKLKKQLGLTKHYNRRSRKGIAGGTS